MTSQTTPDVAGEVRAVAARKRIRQSDLAEMLHLSRMAVHRRMTGAVPFTADELIALSRAMDVPVGEFFSERAA